MTNRLLFFFLISFGFLLFSAPDLSAHPGKTDLQDGHKCLKNCEEWELYYSEYHLHDKDRNPIRLDGKKVRQESVAAPAQGLTPQLQAIPEQEAEQTKITEQKIVTVYEYKMPVKEESVLQINDLLLLILAGILLLALTVLRKKRQ